MQRQPIFAQGLKKRLRNNQAAVLQKPVLLSFQLKFGFPAEVLFINFAVVADFFERFSYPLRVTNLKPVPERIVDAEQIFGRSIFHANENVDV